MNNVAPRSMIILFVGSNPSNSSMCNAAFHSSTMSSRILTSWIKDIEGQKVYINVVNSKTENNRPIKMSEVKLNLERLREDIYSIKPDRIVALGRTAAKALTLLQLHFYEMPHPSGRNRVCNDASYIEEKIRELKYYVGQ